MTRAGSISPTSPSFAPETSNNMPSTSGASDAQTPDAQQTKVLTATSQHQRIAKQTKGVFGNPAKRPQESDETFDETSRKRRRKTYEFRGKKYKAAPFSEDLFVYTLEPLSPGSTQPHINTSELLSLDESELNRRQAQQHLKKTLGQLLENHPTQEKMIQNITLRALQTYSKTRDTNDDESIFEYIDFGDDDPDIEDSILEYMDPDIGSHVLMNAIANEHPDLKSYLLAKGNQSDEDFCREFLEAFADRKGEDVEDVKACFNGSLQDRTRVMKDFLNNYGVDMNGIVVARGLKEDTSLAYVTAALEKKMFFHKGFLSASASLDVAINFAGAFASCDSLVKNSLRIFDLTNDSGPIVAQRKLFIENLRSSDTEYNKGQDTILLLTSKGMRGAMLCKETGLGLTSEREIISTSCIIEPSHLILGKEIHVILGTIMPLQNLPPSLTRQNLPPSLTRVYSLDEVKKWLFNGVPHPDFPASKLKEREQEKYLPKTKFCKVKMLGDDKYTSRIGIHSGSITDLQKEEGETAAICSSNNGDLLTGCGYAIAKAVINAAGPGLQMDLYNQYGVPSVMEQPEFAKKNYAATENRGYAITCDAHDMRITHGIDAIEMLIVPMYDLRGLKNMYKEALQHAKDMDYIALPMAGMTHPLLNGDPDLSAQVATNAAKEFIDSYPESKLKIIFVIYEDKESEELYRQRARTPSSTELFALASP